MTTHLPRAVAAAVVLVAAAACSAGDDGAAGADPGDPPSYPAFADVDPYTHAYFVTLEPTGLAAAQGDERLWNLGTTTCQRLDDGATVATEVDGLVVDANLGDAGGSVLGAAVAEICPHHRAAVDAFLAEQ